MHGTHVVYIHVNVHVHVQLICTLYIVHDHTVFGWVQGV